MKFLILLIPALLMKLESFSQTTTTSRPDILYSEKTGYLSYAGRMDDELWSRLNEDEIKLYDSCLSRLGLSRETVKWYSNELFNHLIKDNHYCSAKMVALKTDPSLNNEKESAGKNKLNSPECMLIITRIPGRIDEVAVVMYF